MPEPTAFKSGKDVAEETRSADDESVTCVDCGATETGEGAYDNGWQLAPPVCPGCLRWPAVGADTCCHGTPS